MKHLYFATLFFTSHFLFAQTGSVKGKIMQIDSITALPGVSVYLESTKLGAASNGNGNYILKNVPVGNYTLTVSAIGYFTLTEEIRVEENIATIANFPMIESISTLSEVTVMTSGSAGIKEMPGSVYYISPKAIEKFSYTDVNRTLRAVPGVNLIEEDGFGLRPNIGLRGSGTDRSSKITIMEDGVLMAPAPYSAPAAYYFPTIGRMQGVEILKGSSQIKYGPYTTGGAINLLSTQIPNEFSAKINLLAGSYGSRNLHANVGNAHKNVAYLVETYQYGSNGFKQLDNGGNTGFDKKDYLAKLRINTSETAKVYQSLMFKIAQVNEISNETYLGLTQEDFDSTPFRRYSGSQVDKITTEQTQLSLTHVARFSELFSVTTTAYRTKLSRNWYKLYQVKDNAGNVTGIANILDNPYDYSDAYTILNGSSGTNPDALFVKANNRIYNVQGVQTILGFNFNTNNISHDIDWGIRLHKDQMDRFQWVDEYAMDTGVMELTKSGIPGTESNRIESARAFATYIQYKLVMGKFTAVPGLRYENMTLSKMDYGKNDINRTGIDLKQRSNHVEVFIPGIGLDYRLNQQINVFAGVHKGFSPPGSKEGTLPEQSISYELGARFNKQSVSGEAVVFVNDYSNLLGTDLAAAGGGGSTELYNAGEVFTKGLEFQLTYDLLSFKPYTPFRLPISIVYTYTDSEFQSDFESNNDSWGQVKAGDAFPYLANNQATFILGLEHEKFNINLSGRYIDEMRTVPGQGAIPANERTDAYFVLDASANYSIHKNVSLFTNATNLTNKVYLVARRPAGLRPGMPRAFNIGIKANF
ncbi:MAG: TonB-dependent receptor [Cyclobacteriaceae bacterium]|nr:TonB-dependent receptor [Cyclobacteriaceae bacterium]